MRRMANDLPIARKISIGRAVKERPCGLLSVSFSTAS
jgi:hypothetical protein